MKRLHSSTTSAEKDNGESIQKSSLQEVPQEQTQEMQGSTACSLTTTKTNDDNMDKKKEETQETTASNNKNNDDNNDKNNNNKNNKNQKMIRKKKCNPQILKVRRIIQECCKTNNIHLAIQTYQKACQDDIKIESQTFYNLLNLCDGLKSKELGIVHIGTPKPTTTETQQTQEQHATTDTETTKESTLRRQEQDNSSNMLSLEERKKYAFEIKCHMDTLHLPLNETAYTALVRILCKCNELQEAYELLKEAETKQHHCKLKLRLYSDLLIAYCHEGQMDRAIELWTTILQHSSGSTSSTSTSTSSNMDITEKEMIALMKCAIQVGNPSIFQRVLKDLAEDVLVPSKDAIQTIVSWFESSHATLTATKDTSTANPYASLQPPPETSTGSTNTYLGPIQCHCSPVPSASSSDQQQQQPQPNQKWMISYGCHIDTATGMLQTGCAKGQRVQPVTLSKDAWDQMIEMNESIVLQGEIQSHTSQYQGGGKGKKRKLQAKGYESRKYHWNNFLTFLKPSTTSTTTSTTAHKQYDVIIDGANVGYYQKNFASAPKHVDYQQIDWIVQHFIQEEHKTVLLILHERHFASSMVPEWAQPIVQKWKSMRQTTKGLHDEKEETLRLLYQTPRGCNDDWFWLHAALVCGPNTLVVTNDEMRDHHFQMLSQRHFIRWKERHQIHFSFGTWSSTKANQRIPILEYPDIYSRRIQRLKQKIAKVGSNDKDQEQEQGDGALVIPLPKQGDENRFLDGMHVANDESTPNEETYVCIQAINI